MDAAKQQAITGCGNCHQPEDAHKHGAGTGQDDLALFAALSGACSQFTASDASVIYARHLAIAGSDPVRRPGRVGKRAPLCERCANRGSPEGELPAVKTTRTGTEPDIQAAPDQLLALAAAMRPAWDRDVLAAALLAAKQAGWTWDRTLAETVRLMRDPGGSPWDLKRAAADPFHQAAVPPGTEKRGAAKARQLLGYGRPADGAA